MEIHGNAFTVWSVWGTEYQSLVSSGDCPFRLHYLKDRNRALRPHRPTECQHYKGSGTEAALFPISVEGQPGKEIDKIFSPSFEPLECNLFNFNSGLITI